MTHKSWLTPAVLLLTPLVVLGQSTVVGTIDPSGQIAFQAVDEFQVSLSRKIKLLPEATGNIDPNVIKRLNKIELPQAGLIRNNGSGRLVKLNPDGKGREWVLPEDFALKAPAPAADVPGRLSLTLVKSKKNKQSDALPQESFFVYLTGASPDRAVLDFVNRDSVFLSFEEQLRAMQGFVASFPGSPSADEFRVTLERKLANGLGAFEDGGRYDDLLLTRRFGELGRKAYPSDPAIQDLQTRILGRIKFVEDKLKLLRSLAVTGDWDIFLDHYQDFERYQGSFNDLVALRRQAFEESARMHSRRARGFALREDHETAMREATRAQDRDPSNREIRNLLDDAKLEFSKGEAKRAASTRKVLDKTSGQYARFQSALRFAERFIQDKDFAKAQESIQDAEKENAEAPEILWMKANLFVVQGRLSEALPYLDRYDRVTIEQADREKGAALRDTINYERPRRKDANRRDIDTLTKAGQYSKLDELLKAALNVDPADPDYLYNGGLVAAALKETDRARTLLADYLEKSNSLDGDLKRRDRASRVLSALSTQKSNIVRDGVANWMSAKKLPDGVYYDPESLAFQLPFDSVIGNKVRMAFTWDRSNHLESIKTTFEDEKGVRAYRELATPGADSPSALAPAGPDEGSFYFQYLSAGPLRNVRTKGPAAGSKDFKVVVAHAAQDRVFLANDDGQPEVVLASHPNVDIGIMAMLEGPVATTVAGNSFFHPFLWDGLHYFTLQYDALGRVDSAQEWNADNLVRFIWEGERLKEIRAFRKGGAAPYYRRTLTYSGNTIMKEDATGQGKAGEIAYVYGTNRALQEVKIKNDGKDWAVKPRP